MSSAAVSVSALGLPVVAQNDRKPVDGFRTKSSSDQVSVELDVHGTFKNFLRGLGVDPNTLHEGQDGESVAFRGELQREKHVRYLQACFKHLPAGMVCLDASRTWLCYWTLHALDLLGGVDKFLTQQEMRGCVHFLGSCCQNKQTGGFGGGPGQNAHMAPTYSAVLSLCILNSYTTIEGKEGEPGTAVLDIVDRKKLYAFLYSMKNDNGSFKMTKFGESDTRSAYCALVAATLMGVLTEELVENTAEWVASCVGVEGGIGAEPGNEAHGGYTFCGLAALILLGRVDCVDEKRVLKWAAMRQMGFEGGFQGRSNKLVDGCYSFWVGGVFALVDIATQMKQVAAAASSTATSSSSSSSSSTLSSSSLTQWAFNQAHLQKYILTCCQHERGGLLDKPFKHRDLYHTCYVLSGLSVSQNNPDGKTASVLGPETNLLPAVNPVFNLVDKHAVTAMGPLVSEDMSQQQQQQQQGMDVDALSS
jgi:protein farnesyltransferase subunit beta